MTSPRLGQRARLLTAAAYVVALVLVAVALFGALPSFGLTGMWLYAGAAAILLGSALVEPHFTRPSDAIGNGLALLLAGAAVDPREAVIAGEHVAAGRAALVGYALVIIVAGAGAIYWKDGSGRAAAGAARLSRLLRQAGRATWVFSLLYFAAVWAAFADDPRTLFVLCATWSLIFGAAPLERLAAWTSTKRRPSPAGTSAVVETIDDPQMVELRLTSGTAPKPGWLAAFPDAGVSGHVVGVTQVLNPQRVLVALGADTGLMAGEEVHVTFGESDGAIIGYVAPETTIDELVVLVSAIRPPPPADPNGQAESDEDGPPLREGALLRVDVAGRDALYQVIGGEVVRAHAPGARRGQLEVRARKLGWWNETHEVFVPVAWLPRPGTSVYLEARSQDGPPTAPRWVGSVPGTSFGAAFDVHRGVTHNTAILGVLGSGKTTLAWELMGRILAAGVKVLVLDISGRYRPEFDDLVSVEEDEAIHSELAAKIAASVGNLKVVGGEAGNVADFRIAVRDLLTRFVDGDSRLLIINPLRLEITDIDLKGFDEHKRTLRPVTSVEVTRIVSEELLALLRDRVEFDDAQARVCLVLEEAHSLVPEWNSATEKAEEHGAVGTVRAILQGRKYGFGCLLITQRTANVTKSILNQCNTVFALQVFDATGMDFLQNYIGRTHARLLGSLKPQQAVIYGQAFHTTAPLVVDLNHRTDAFIPEFWEEASKGVPKTTLSTSPSEAAEEEPAPF